MYRPADTPAGKAVDTPTATSWETKTRNLRPLLVAWVERLEEPHDSSMPTIVRTNAVRAACFKPWALNCMLNKDLDAE